MLKTSRSIWFELGIFPLGCLKNIFSKKNKLIAKEVEFGFICIKQIIKYTYIIGKNVRMCRYKCIYEIVQINFCYGWHKEFLCLVLNNLIDKNI